MCLITTMLNWNQEFDLTPSFVPHNSLLPVPTQWQVAIYLCLHDSDDRFTSQPICGSRVWIFQSNWKVTYALSYHVWLTKPYILEETRTTSSRIKTPHIPDQRSSLPPIPNPSPYAIWVEHWKQPELPKACCVVMGMFCQLPYELLGHWHMSEDILPTMAFCQEILVYA